MEQQKDALRSLILNCFSGILSGDQNQIRDAEEDMKALEIKEEYGLVLVEIALTTEGPIDFRQLAAVILKQYIKNHWSKSEEYGEPLPSPDIKRIVRELLLSGLGDTASKIRATVANAISTIAQYDWPEEWPDLFDQLMSGLNSGSPQLVHGTMRVLAELSQEITDAQIHHMAPILFPHLLQIIVTPELYNARTRTRAITIFSTISHLIYTISSLDKSASKTLLYPFLPHYISEFVKLLMSDEGDNDDPGLRKETIDTLGHLIEWYSSYLQPHLMAIVTPVWNVLIASTNLYVLSVVNSSDNSVDVYDSEGEVINFDSVLLAIIRFITNILMFARQPQLFPPILPQLVCHLISLVQITTEQASTWEADPNRYVEDDESELAFSVRLFAFDLLTQFADHSDLSGHTCQAIIGAVDRHLTNCPRESHTEWWRIHEACLLVMGSILIDKIKEGVVQYDIQLFFDQVVQPDLSSSTGPPLLVGRCLWLAGKSSCLLRSDAIHRCLEATVTGLHETQHNIVRVMAAKSTYNFCIELKGGEHAPLLHPYLPYFITELCQMASETSESILFIVLDVLHEILKIDSNVTAMHAERIVPISVALFLQYAHEHGVVSCLEDIFMVLAGNPGCQPILHARLLPSAVDILAASESQVPLGVVSAILDVLVIIIRSCSLPLPPVFIDSLFCVIVDKILTSEDTAVLQNGGECIRAYLSVAAEQLLSWSDGSGQSGLQYAAQVVMRLLDPLKPETSAAFVDKLIIVFVRKVGAALGSYLELLLRSVLSKMQQVQTDTVMQSLLIVFAHLASSDQLEGLLSFLSQVPDPNGRPALEYVVTQWCLQHSCFFGDYEIRVSTLALCHLLSHCVNTGDQRLNNIVVPEQENNSTGIKTRSKSANKQWIQIPLPIKLLKVLIADLRTLLEKAECSDDDNEDEGEDDEEDTWSSNAEVGDLVNSLDALLASGGDITEDAGEVDDPDLKDDVLLQINLQSHLVLYLNELSQHSSFPTFLPHLSPYEKDILNAVGVMTS